MKKKSCMLLLSFSLVFSTFAPAMTYAEENEILAEESVETNDNDSQVTGSELTEDNTSISIESIQSVELNAPVTAEEQAAVQELADAQDVEWHNLEQYNLRYRYKDNVLRIELLDENQPEGTADFGSSAPWATAEAKTVTKIEIGDKIDTIGARWFYAGTTSYYTSVKEVVLPSTVKKIGVAAFDHNFALQNINLENVEEIGIGAFQSTSLVQARLDSVKSIGSSAFYNCSSLTEVQFSSVESVEDSTFKDCSSLVQIQLNSVKSIATSAFDGCSSLVALQLDSVERIDAWAFGGCSSLQYLTLGKADVTIAKRGFVGDELEAVCYAGTESQWKAICATESKGLKNAQAVHCKAEEAPKAATCLEAGDKTSVCGICKEAYKDDNGTENPALGHDYVSSVTKEATCTEDGVQTDTCTRCGDTKPQAIKALGHDYAGEYTVDVAATCTTAGSQSKHCTKCGKADPASVQEIPALGHDYTSQVTKAATCTEDGVQTDTCTRCGDVKTQVIKATGHQWGDWTKTADATVGSAEQQQRTCATCGAVETKTVGEKLAPTATVNASTVTLKVKQSTKGLKVTDLAVGDSVASWKSTNTKVFTVKGNADGTCTLTGKKKGSAKLEITLASGLTKTVTVKVQKTAVKTSKVKVAEKKLTVKKGEKASLKATVAPFTSAQKLTYTSSNKKVATVSKNGVVTAKKAGTAKITVKSGSKKVVVTVTVPKTKTTAITVAENITVKKGKTYSLKTKVAPKNSDEKITYTSSNKKIATVTKSGKVKGVKKGTATITVKSGSEAIKVNVTVK